MTTTGTASPVTGEWNTQLSALLDEVEGLGIDPPQWDEVVSHKNEFDRQLLQLDLDELAGPAGLAVDEIKLVADGHWGSDVSDAIHRLDAHVSNGAVHFFHSNQLMGWTNRLAGTVFEQKVLALANAGKITLPQGVDHVVLGAHNQEAWDLALMAREHVVGHAQVKFSSGSGPILLHLQHFPDVPIVITNHEAAVAAAHHGVHVIDAGIHYAPLHDHVAHQVASHLGAAHLAHEWLPEVAVVLIGCRVAMKVKNGDDPQTVKRWATSELAKAGVSNFAATMVSFTPHGALLRIPTAMATRFTLDRGDVARDNADFADALKAKLRLIGDPVCPPRAD